MRNIIESCRKNAFVILFVLSLLCVGLFHEETACLCFVLLAGLLLWQFSREKRLEVQINAASVAIAAIVGFYGLSCLWAVDSGLAFIGFLKYLPLLPFVLLLHRDARERMLGLLPYIMAVITVLSAIGSFIPSLKPYFTVADRLAGFLQYPNTFALLLLVAQLLLVTQKKRSILNGLVLAVLVFGLLYSGSRTVFLLAVAANVALGLFTKNKKIRLITLLSVGAGAVAVALFAAFSDSDILGRYLRFSLSESTFAGRFLYYLDALPVILKHPFGLGYMGYYYIQQSIQTGVYAVAYIHNDFLQLMLDIGWLPCAALLFAMFRAFRRATLGNKIILAVLFGHFCFDFDLQFIAVFFVLLLFLDTDSGKTVTVRSAKPLYAAVPLALVSLYMSITLLLPPQTARALYPWDTRVNTELLTRSETVGEGKALADQILAQNEYVTLAYSMESRYYYTKGQFGQLISCKNATFEKFPFQYAEYEEYCRMLINGITLYSQAGNTASVKICRQELLATKEKLDALTGRLSYLGSIIADQPNTTLPGDVLAYINSIN